jgi:SAM-dependent methyltransferase
VLDVGCGSGPFLSFARGQGWQDLTGLELSPVAAAAARASSGARVLEQGLEEADLPPGHFAVVAFWDVLEHLPEPRRALQRAAALLRPGGLVAISTPNRFGVAASVFGHRSVVVCPPEHLLLASRGGLRTALVDAGLEVDGIWSEDLRIREWTRALGRGSAEGTGGEDRDRYRRAQAGLTGASWFETARSVANVVLRATRLGDQLLAIAGKPAAGKAGRP